jgi:hypothetical protein
MKREAWLLIGICALGALHHLATAPPSAIDRAPGVLAPDPPEQREARETRPIAIGDFQLTPRAEFRAAARLLSRTSYSDEGADLSPIDFALGWGRMSDSAVLAGLSFSHGARFFNYRWSNQPPIPPHEIVVSVANVHIIPADSGVERDLQRMRAGQVIEIEGLLVDARRDDGWFWNTSLSREDNGKGACELMLVQSVRVIDAGD